MPTRTDANGIFVILPAIVVLPAVVVVVVVILVCVCVPLTAACVVFTA